VADSICGLYGMRILLAVKRPRSWALSGAITAGLSKRDVSAAHRRVEGQTFAGTRVQTATMDVTISVLRDVDHSVLR
jgi:hypothetical protein